MDSSGNNRYELLFMDEDGGAAPAAPAAPVVEVAKKKAPSAATKPQTAAKKPGNAEKENKAGTLNKNDASRKAAAGSGQNARPPKQGAVSNIRPPRPNGAAGGDEGGRSVGFRQQNSEVREQRNNRRNNMREGGFGNSGGGGGGGGEFEPRRDFEQRPPRQFRDRDNRGPPRTRFGAGEGGFRGGKREFDRQSGSDKTGVKAVDKRDGAGAHNWGSVKQEIDDINKSSDTATNQDAETTLTDKEESANEQSATEQAAVPEEEETKEFTLDEWKAMRQQRTKPQFNLRKAGEGEDTSQWKKMVVLSKKKEGDSEEELEYDPSLYPQRVGRLQRIVDIKFNFNDGRRGGGSGFGRGGRGRGGPGRPGGERGGRFEGAGRGGEGQEPRFERGPGGGGRFEGNRGEGRFEGGRGEGRFEGGRGEGRFEGGRGEGRSEGAGGRFDGNNPGRPRNFGDRQRGAGFSALKVDDERQFPTLS